MMQQPAFGLRLRELRTARGLSQAAVASDQISTSYLSRLESGERPPTPQVVAILAERLGVPPSELGDVREGDYADIIARGFNTLSEFDTAITRDMVVAQSSYDATIQWQLLWGLAEAYAQAGALDQQRESLDALVALSDGIGSPTLAVRSRVQLSKFQRAAGDLHRAAQLGRDAIQMARTTETTATETVRALSATIAAEAELGRLSKARDLADELLEVIDAATTTIASTLVAEARWVAATVHLRQGLFDQAASLIELAIDQFDSHDDLVLWIRLRIAAASLYLQMKPRRLDAARERMLQVEPLIPLVASRQQVQEVQTVRAHIAFHEGRFDDAQMLADELADEPVLLSFRDQVRMDILRFRLQLASGDAQLALNNLSALANRLQDSAIAELASEAWSSLAEAVTPGQ